MKMELNYSVIEAKFLRHINRFLNGMCHALTSGFSLSIPEADPVLKLRLGVCRTFRS